VTRPRPSADMLTVMPTFELICLVAIALSAGYVMGRRSARSAPAWFGGSRRSRLARQAIGLMALGAATRARQSLRRRFRPSRSRSFWLAG
jgi:hypothetical protein